MAKKKRSEYEYNSEVFNLEPKLLGQTERVKKAQKTLDREEDKAIAKEIREAQSTICGGRIKCTHCGKNFGVCSEIETQLTEENTNMIPQGNAGSQSQGAGGRSRPQQQGLEYARWNSPWLSFDWKTARILSIKVNQPVEGRQQFSDVVVKFALDGQQRLLGMKVDSRELTTLTQQFGSDENKWIDGEFQIRIEEDDFDGKKYVRIQTVETSSKKKGK